MHIKIHIYHQIYKDFCQIKMDNLLNHNRNKKYNNLRLMFLHRINNKKLHKINKMTISSKILMIQIRNSKNIRRNLDCNNFWIYHKILKITLFNKGLLYSLPNIVKIKINYKKNLIPSIHIIESKCIFLIKHFKLTLTF